ncbi:hypothetical protein PCE1_003315 [Barthelona sp. PCE]
MSINRHKRTWAERSDPTPKLENFRTKTNNITCDSIFSELFMCYKMIDDVDLFNLDTHTIESTTSPFLDEDSPSNTQIVSPRRKRPTSPRNVEGPATFFDVYNKHMTNSKNYSHYFLRNEPVFTEDCVESEPFDLEDLQRRNKTPQVFNQSCSVYTREKARYCCKKHDGEFIYISNLSAFQHIFAAEKNIRKRTITKSEQPMKIQTTSNDQSFTLDFF